MNEGHDLEFILKPVILGRRAHDGPVYYAGDLLCCLDYLHILNCAEEVSDPTFLAADHSLANQIANLQWVRRYISESGLQFFLLPYLHINCSEQI